MKIYILLLLLLFACNNAPQDEVNKKKSQESKKEVSLPTAEVTVDWTGVSSNIVIKLINVDSSFMKADILDYSRKNHRQRKKDQNVYLYFFHGDAPNSVPIAQFEPTNPDKPKVSGSFGVQEFVKRKKPYMTVTIIGDGEYSINEGFEY